MIFFVNDILWNSGKYRYKCRIVLCGNFYCCVYMERVLFIDLKYQGYLYNILRVLYECIVVQFLFEWLFIYKDLKVKLVCI